MEITREIYWNVGHGAMTLIPMYLFAFLGIGAIIYGFYKRYQVYKIGKPLNRTDNIGERISFMFENMIGQVKVVRSDGAGIFHSLFFWSFILLFIGTCLIVIQADFSELFFDYVFLKGAFYKVFSIVLDIAGLLAIFMLSGLFIRRYFIKPEGLETSRDDMIMHILLFAILFTGFLIEGTRMAATEMKTNPEWMIYSPVGMVIAKIVSGMADTSLLFFHKILWWMHFFLVIVFFVIIPRTKFRHIFTTTANYMFSDMGPTGKLITIDLEDEDSDSFGASKVTDFTWKDIFDRDACTKCKRCQDACPAYNTGKPLSPMEVINKIGDVAFNDPEKNLIDEIGQDSIWACTTCFACQDICPASIEHVSKLIELRRNLVLMEGEFPGEEVMSAMDNVEVNGNPMGLAMAARGDWTEGLDVVIMSDFTETEEDKIDVIYFVGCYASFDSRNIKIARNFIKICNSSGIHVGILGKEEKCCGEPVRKMGNEYLYQSVAAENIENLKKYGDIKIVTTCPHCFNTLNKDYRDFGFETEVEHYTVFLNRLMEEDRIPMKVLGFNCTYHDSCYLARHNDIVDEPRELLEAVGANIVEMDLHKKDGFCCSAGGGRIIAEEKIGEKMNVKRVNMARETGAPVLISNCPFCMTMFEDGIKMADCEDSLKVKDLSEVIVQRLYE